MNVPLVCAAFLTVAVGAAHSYLGERYILRRLFRRDNLPWLFGSDQFTKVTLRFAWHLTTVTWWGVAVVLWLAASGASADFRDSVLVVFAGTFLVCGVTTLFASRGRHLAWIVFVAIALLILVARI